METVMVTSSAYGRLNSRDTLQEVRQKKVKCAKTRGGGVRVSGRYVAATTQVHEPAMERREKP
jgi:hypothetical protein